MKLILTILLVFSAITPRALSESRCVPELENGKAVSYQCFSLEKEAPVQKPEPQENDMICGLDGKNLSVCIQRQSSKASKPEKSKKTARAPEVAQ